MFLSKYPQTNKNYLQSKTTSTSSFTKKQKHTLLCTYTEMYVCGSTCMLHTNKKTLIAKSMGHKY